MGGGQHSALNGLEESVESRPADPRGGLLGESVQHVDVIPKAFVYRVCGVQMAVSPMAHHADHAAAVAIPAALLVRHLDARFHARLDASAPAVPAVGVVMVKIKP